MYASFCSCVHASQSPGPGGPGGVEGAADALGAALAAGGALGADATAEDEGAGASLEAAGGGLLGAAASGWPPPHATTEERATRQKALRARRGLTLPQLVQHQRSGCQREQPGRPPPPPPPP